MVIIDIKLKGFTGTFRADVIAFNRENKHILIDVMTYLGLDVPLNPTLAQLKEAARGYGDDYPCGFKHIYGRYCFYECLG